MSRLRQSAIVLLVVLALAAGGCGRAKRTEPGLKSPLKIHLEIAGKAQDVGLYEGEIDAVALNLSGAAGDIQVRAGAPTNYDFRWGFAGTGTIKRQGNILMLDVTGSAAATEARSTVAVPPGKPVSAALTGSHAAVLLDFSGVALELLRLVDLGQPFALKSAAPLAGIIVLESGVGAVSLQLPAGSRVRLTGPGVAAQVPALAQSGFAPDGATMVSAGFAAGSGPLLTVDLQKWAGVLNVTIQ